MRESKVRFALVDPDTIEVIHVALRTVDFEVNLLSIGCEELKGTTNLSELLNDDGSGIKLQRARKLKLCLTHLQHL